ncbi:hypothetical protein MRX96_014627 [Rhipicephalus microplus]
MHCLKLAWHDQRRVPSDFLSRCLRRTQTQLGDFMPSVVPYLTEGCVSCRSGVRAIPFMQVVLMLSSDLDSEDDRDRTTLDNLLSSLIGELEKNVARLVQRSPSSE